MGSTIEVLLLPADESRKTLKLTLPPSWRRKRVAALAAACAKRAAPAAGGAPRLWRGADELPGDALLETVLREDRPLARRHWTPSARIAEPAKRTGR